MPDTTTSPKRVVAIMRGVFIGLLVLQLFFGMAAMWFVSYRRDPQTPADHPWALYALGAAALVLLAIAGYVIRRRLYERRRGDDGTVDTSGYLWGNLAVLVPMGLVGLAGLALAIAGGALFPALLITLAALILQVINMPTGDPLDSGRYSRDQTPSSA